MKWYERYLQSYGLHDFAPGHSQGHRIPFANLVWIDPPFDETPALQRVWARDTWWHTSVGKQQRRWATVQQDEHAVIIHLVDKDSCVFEQSTFDTMEAATSALREWGFQPLTSTDFQKVGVPLPPYYRS